MSQYEVIVGNIGTVYSGPNGSTANTKYQTYVGQSKRGYGRAAGESVVLMRDGEIVKEWFGTQENPPGGWLPAKAVRIRKVGRGTVVDVLTTRNPLAEGYVDEEGRFRVVPLRFTNRGEGRKKRAAPKRRKAVPKRRKMGKKVKKGKR